MIDNIRYHVEFSANLRVPSNYHPSPGCSNPSEPGTSYAGHNDAGSPSDCGIAESLEFFLETQEPHGVKRKFPVDVNAFDHRKTKRHCRVFKTRTDHGMKRKPPISNDTVDETTEEDDLDLSSEPKRKRIVMKLGDGSSFESENQTADDSVENEEADDFSLDLLERRSFGYDFLSDLLRDDSNDDTEIIPETHEHCYCRKPARVITQIAHKLPLARPMRVQLLKRRSNVVPGSGNVCCPRYCCFGWKWVAPCEVYRQYR